MVVLSALTAIAGWPTADIPLGDITGSMRLEPDHPVAGMPTRLVVCIHNSTPGSPTSLRPELPPGYSQGPWTIEPAEEANGVFAWNLTFTQPGKFTLPDIPIWFRRQEKALRPTGPMLRFIDGIEVVVGHLHAANHPPGPLPHPLAAVLVVMWSTAPIGWIVWRLYLWLTWPGTREAWRARLTTMGLPPGRHLPDQAKAFWASQGWPMNRLIRALDGNDAWPDPRPLQAAIPYFWILWLAMGAL